MRSHDPSSPLLLEQQVYWAAGAWEDVSGMGEGWRTDSEGGGGGIFFTIDPRQITAL